MFKIESYITPILLSYFDKYIKNFRPQDSQLSLWGGEASFHNLDLRLEVLEQELQLPFTFVSGHIHELLIQVPWTKLASEPITVTINTIECILKLKSKESTANLEAQLAKDRHKRIINKRQDDEKPTGYVEALINKIVSNIKVFCNNLILKYVEEDIVVSTNVKLFKLESADQNWDPFFIDTSSSQVTLRKLITILDLTICLDKRNAAGKIDVYQEPMLYKCSLKMHMLRRYKYTSVKRSSTTRFDIYCESMEFSMTEQQVPMVMRIAMLLYALQQRHFSTTDSPIPASSPSLDLETSEHSESWAGWAWSFVPSLLSPLEDIDLDHSASTVGHILHIGFYVDYASITFKVLESNSSTILYYPQRKLRYLPLITLRLQGAFMETISLGYKWFQSSCGVSQIVLLPVARCCCGYNEVPDGSIPIEYLKIGKISMTHKSDSLFDHFSPENNGKYRIYNHEWDYHLETVTEDSLLERTAGFAMDYIYVLDTTDDISSEQLSDLGYNLEYSNFQEKSLMRIVFGNGKLQVNNGFYHRISSLRVAASVYDYQPYYTPKPDLLLSELPPSCADDFDALSENIPSRSMYITICSPIIELQMMNHPHFEPSVKNLFKKFKNPSNAPEPSLPNYSGFDLPIVTLECHKVVMKILNPMYVKRLVYTICQLPDPPLAMFNSCHTVQNIQVIGLCSRLIMAPKRQTIIIAPSSTSYSFQGILKPQYWVNPDVPHEELTLESESITITGTKAKFMVIYHILNSFFDLNGQDCVNKFCATSLLRDAICNFGMSYLELCVEGLRLKKVKTNCTVTIDASLSSIKGFVFETAVEWGVRTDACGLYPLTSNSTYSTSLKLSNVYSSKSIHQILFISGPDIKRDQPKFETFKKEKLIDAPLLLTTIQFPINPNNQQHPAILTFRLQEITVCLDPLLCKWFSYNPETFVKKNGSIGERFRKSSGSILETPNRIGTPHESIHSCSDKDHSSIPIATQPVNEANTSNLQDSAHNFLQRWFTVWKNMLLNGESAQCTIYLPVKSLSAVGAQGIREAIGKGLSEIDPPDILVITLPLATFCSASQKTGLTKYLTHMPVILPHTMWTAGKAGFPWVISVSDVSIYTLQNGHKLNFLNPVFLNITVGVSTKQEASESSSMSFDLKSTDNTYQTLITNANSAHSASKLVSSELKTDYGPLGLCVHVDMSSITLCISEVQICLIASILRGLKDIITNILPETPKEIPTYSDLQGTVSWGSQISPPLKQSSIDSFSENTTPIVNISSKLGDDSVKLTAWIQWTIARFRIKILAHDNKSLDFENTSYLFKPNLKLVFDAEDIVSSIDFQHIYLKIKNKVASASAHCFKRSEDDSNWVPGECLGVIMRASEDASPTEKQDDTAFATFTITSASSTHTHAMWGALQKDRCRKDTKSGKHESAQIQSQSHSQSLYITEILFTSQPIDFILCSSHLQSFYSVFEHLCEMTESQNENEEFWLLQLNNQNLPLIYVECRIRIIMPSSELKSADTGHDICIFQVDGINLMPSAVNPICRTPCRPDIYQMAAQLRILNVPGSEAEDRQYQLDVTGLSISTGSLDEVLLVLNLQENNLTTLRTMSENPALEWNNFDKSQLNATTNLNLLPLIDKFSLSIIIAPAMMYKTNTLVCGHSVEVNCITDIDINISLYQIKLVSTLLSELLQVCIPRGDHIGLRKRPNLVFPYQNFVSNVDEESISTGHGLDSGIDTAEFLSILSVKSKEFPQDTDMTKHSSTNKSSADSEKSYGVFPRPPTLMSSMLYIPVDVLITCGKISIMLYEIVTLDKTNQSRYIRKTMTKETESESGYDASAEGSLDELPYTTHLKQFSPLIFISVCQPNIFLSRFNIGKKVHLTCFDIKMKLGGSDSNILRRIPTEDDFLINLLETKSGIPLPNTGILPSFFTLKWSKGLSKPATVEVELAKPTRILCSVSNWNYVISTKEKVLDSIKYIWETANPRCVDHSNDEDTISDFNIYRTHESYTKFKQIKTVLHGISNLNIKFSQIVLAMKTENLSEVNLSIYKFTNSLKLLSRPERIINKIIIENLCIGVVQHNLTRLLLNPWSFSVETSLFWESWQSYDSNPQIQVCLDSDSIMIDVSPEQIKSVHLVVKELSDFIYKICDNSSVDLELDLQSTSESYRTTSFDKEQFYKDDLRAGAFQFVDSLSPNIEEFPLPYQVMFWNKPVAAMAWRYPQPRALTKIRIFPVPFKSPSESYNFSDYQVRCHIEYWCECQGCYLPYLQFCLSESEMCQLDLPENNVQSVSCIWRVVLHTYSEDSEESNFESSRSVISARALAACMRIDSYFNKVLIPDVSVLLQLSTVNISLYSTFDKSLPVTMPECLNHYTCDLLFPANHCFLTLTLDASKAYLTTWNFEAASIDVTTSIKCSILDYAFLTQQTLVEPFSLKIGLNLFNNICLNIISKPLNFKFSPSIAHTMAVSIQMWEESMRTNLVIQDSHPLIIMTQYVVCNNTNINIRFGQANTDETIVLSPRYCHLYCWRSQKIKPLLRIGLEDNGWTWSKSFKIDSESVEIIHICLEKKLNIVVTVKNLSSTQKQITFSGQFTISNMLLEHFEMKIVPHLKEDNDSKEFKKASSYIVAGKCILPSFLIDTNQKYHLRLRFLGLESAWSGDIPLEENSKCAQPWLVKVPLQERGQFLSIWCQIMVEKISGNCQILVILWPLYMVRSNLPGNAKVHIETPALKIHLESTVPGKGECQQLYCPGTIDHSHQLSFHFEDGSTKSNPYVPLNYSLVDAKQFFKKLENENVNDLLKIIRNFDTSSWPYVGDDFAGIDWICEEQPLTHVQVRYQNACPSSSSLLVELLPWCLMINMLGCPVTLLIDEKEVCLLNHHGIVTPPKIEGIFHIAIAVSETWNISLPLQLAKSEWGKPFYKPRITGTIPDEGSAKTAILCPKNVTLCMVSITSTMVNEMKLLKISSTHVITNYLDMQVHVVCFAVNESEPMVALPEDISRNYFTVTPHLDRTNTGVSIMQWLAVGDDIDLSAEFALYISVSVCLETGWSCPVRVDKTDKSLNRKNIFVPTKDQCISLIIVGQEYNGQIYLSVHKDRHPQILIKNKSDTKLFFAEWSINDTVVMDCEHFNWLCGVESNTNCYYSMPSYTTSFPDISQKSIEEKLVIASDPQGDPRGYQWSSPISVSNCSEQFLHIPFYGDIKVTISNLCYTLLLYITSASEVEISAQDIRIRLFMQENELNIENSVPRSPDLSEEFASASSNTTTILPSKTSSSVDLRPTFSDSDVDSKSPTIKIIPFQMQTFSPRPSFGFQTLPTLIEHSTGNAVGADVMGIEPSDCSIPTSMMKYFDITRKNRKNFKITVFIKGVTVTLISNSNNSCDGSAEIGNFVCDDIVLSAIQSEELWITASVSEIQFDNQMYSRGSFDFPVVLVGQLIKKRDVLQSLNTEINHWITNAQVNPLIRVDVSVNTHEMYGQCTTIRNIKDINISIQPFSVYIEDTYITQLVQYFAMFIPTKLVLLSKGPKLVTYNLNSDLVRIPRHISWEAVMLANPLTMRSITIQPVSLLLSLHSSLKLYIALHQSPLQFGKFERTRVITTSYRLGHTLTMHYLSGAIFGAGWVVGSLELLGSPGGLARAMGTGLHDFISLPCRGFLEGPWGFLWGITNGSASLMRHVTAGTLQSVTKLASSVARNLDRMTLDEEHLKRTEEQRRHCPQGVTEGFLQGLTGLGISLLGAVGGIAHHPLQAVMTEGVSPRGLATGVGLGLVGIITKPLSGAADLVALTGQGLLQGAGWNPSPEPRTQSLPYHIYTCSNSCLKYNWKFLPSTAHGNLLFMNEATWITNNKKYEGVSLVLTTDALIVLSIEEDAIDKVYGLQELSDVVCSLDPTLLCFKLHQAVTSQTNENETIVMDPACRARVADYVRNSVGLLQFPDDVAGDSSEASTSQHKIDSTLDDATVVTFYVNPQTKNYLISLLQLAKQQHQNYNYPVL